MGAIDHAHAALDAAVAETYGWGEDWHPGALDDDTILARLFALKPGARGRSLSHPAAMPVPCRFHTGPDARLAASGGLA